MLDDLSYKYYHKLNSKTVYIVLHGGGAKGIETSFIAKIINSLQNTGNSVFGFNFPYCERGEEQSSGEELIEEIATLSNVVEFLKNEGYEKIIIVAKSLGGVITSYWLDKNPSEKIEVIILGYVIASVKTSALSGRLRLVIQGENDRFGNAEMVGQELAKHKTKAELIEIPKADHSYCNENKEPVYQDCTISQLIQKL